MDVQREALHSLVVSHNWWQRVKRRHFIIFRSNEPKKKSLAAAGTQKEPRFLSRRLPPAAQRGQKPAGKIWLLLRLKTGLNTLAPRGPSCTPNSRQPSCPAPPCCLRSARPAPQGRLDGPFSRLVSELSGQIWLSLTHSCLLSVLCRGGRPYGLAFRRAPQESSHAVVCKNVTRRRASFHEVLGSQTSLTLSCSFPVCYQVIVLPC